MFLHIKVKPNSKIDQLFYDKAGALIAKIKAPAQDGKANTYLVAFLAEKIGIPKSNIQIISGLTNPHKKLDINIEGLALRKFLEDISPNF